MQLPPARAPPGQDFRAHKQKFAVNEQRRRTCRSKPSPSGPRSSTRRAGACGLRPIGYPGGGADTARGGGAEVPGGTLGWLLAVLVIVVVVFLIVQFVM